MNEENDQKPEGHGQDFSEYAKHSRPRPYEQDAGSGSSLLRGCIRALGILAGVVAVVFFLIVGVCFIGPSL